MEAFSFTLHSKSVVLSFESNRELGNWIGEFSQKDSNA